MLHKVFDLVPLVDSYPFEWNLSVGMLVVFGNIIFSQAVVAESAGFDVDVYNDSTLGGIIEERSFATHAQCSGNHLVFVSQYPAGVDGVGVELFGLGVLD